MPRKVIPKRCVWCGVATDSRVRNGRRQCLECGMKRMVANLKGLHRREGDMYDKWRESMWQAGQRYGKRPDAPAE